ncbi:MAG: tetratricopeptide repeat protein [Rhizobacter sp.]|nr:tetratricopeptide repeat protein [Chlorobiales bacterium]
MSNYTAALESYYHALRLCRAATDKDTMAILLNNIGNIYQEWRDSERAISYYHESLELKREIADEAGMAHTFNNLANEYTDLGKYAKARRYYLDALRLHQKSSDKKGEATSQLNIAKLHTKMSQIPAALLTLQQALTLSKTMKDKLLTANIWLEMGHIKLRENFFEEGKRLLYKAMRISKSINAQSIIYECHHSLYELYKQIGNSQKALMHLEMFYTVKTAVLGEETSRKLKNLEITHELEKEYRKTEAYRSQIGLLRDEAASKSKEIAAAAMHLIEKSNAVAGLRSQVIELTNEPKKKRRIKILKEVSVAMVSVMDSEKDWAAFERQFNYLYPHFAASLMAACETLTPVELNICALLRLNLATKEIGKVLHRTTRTVESHRNTLRRKLAVPTQTSLPAFLAKL